MTDLAKVAKDKGIKYFLISFTDLFGVQRSKLVPARAIGDMQKDGAGFAGFAAWLDMIPSDPDMFAMPDPDAMIQLPWKPEVAWVPADLMMSGKYVAQAPRVMLKEQLALAEKQGYYMKTGVEAEFFLVNADGTAISDGRDIQEKPCYDQAALMRRFDVVSEICDHMGELGFGPYQNDHEDANGQFEMNFDYDDALKTADRHAFFKFMVKSVAEKHGLRATFMPKPFLHLTGNGCHAHVSVWDKKGKTNLFLDKKDEMGISKLGYQFLGGVLNSAEPLCAIFNPTVNSYKRINAPAATSGASWSPNTVTYTGNNRTHMVRIPDPGRFEFRLMDGAANPYLLQAGLLATGLDGIENKRDPGPRSDVNMYDPAVQATAAFKKAKKLPLNLLDALRSFEKSTILKDALGSEFMTGYVKLKMDEWNAYSHHLTEWERQNSLDC